MQGEKRERWLELCELAAKEQDSKKLLELIREINQILEEKEERLKTQRQDPSRAAINLRRIIRPLTFRKCEQGISL